MFSLGIEKPEERSKSNGTFIAKKYTHNKENNKALHTHISQNAKIKLNSCKTVSETQLWLNSDIIKINTSNSSKDKAFKQRQSHHTAKCLRTEPFNYF